MDRLTLEALMKTDSNEILTFNGRTRTVGEHLRAILKGEAGAEISPTPPAPAPGQPGAPMLRISQAAIDALPEPLYKELEQTGHIQGLTNSDNGRFNVSVRAAGGLNNTGAHSVSFSFGEDGKVEAGRPLDGRDFYAPYGEQDKHPHLVRRPDQGNSNT